MLGQQYSCICRVNQAVVSGNDLSSIVDGDLLPAFVYFDRAADELARNRVSIGIDRYKPFDINDAMEDLDRIGNVDGKWLQVRPFGGVQIDGFGLQVSLVTSVDPVAPVSGLPIGILPVSELATGQKVVFDKVEGAFDAATAV
jgi:hypothetical protein